MGIYEVEQFCPGLYGEYLVSAVVIARGPNHAMRQVKVEARLCGYKFENNRLSTNLLGKSKVNIPRIVCMQHGVDYEQSL